MGARGRPSEPPMLATTLRPPPGPKGTRLAGVLKPFNERRLDFLLECARTYGPVCALRLGPRRTLLVSDPDLIEHVLATDARHYRSEERRVGKGRRGWRSAARCRKR